MFKVTSRGTKASLATLVITSAYLPSIAALSEESCDLVIRAAKDQGSALSTDSLDVAASRAGKFHGATSQQAMKYAWAAGGRLQKSGSKIDFSNAVKGLSITSTDDNQIKDFWS